MYLQYVSTQPVIPDPERGRGPAGDNDDAAMVGLKEMARLDAARQPPAWLDPLVATRFFEVCPDHPDVSAIRSTRSIGCNYFCTNCADGALCSGCFADHRGHQLIQVRIGCVLVLCSK